MSERGGFAGPLGWRKAAQRRGRAPLGAAELEQLEDRLVPSGTPTVDLTTPGAYGQVNGAIFLQANTQPTGSGVIHSFVRMQAYGSQATVEQGYNTDARPLQFDENKSPTFTRSLPLNELPTVDVGGTVYRVFLLDVNQKSSQPLLSLDALRLYVGSSPNLSGYDATSSTPTLGGLAPVYDLDAGGDNWILLDARLNHGSGSGDMLMYVPDYLFVGGGSTPYVYLYSMFGVNYAGNAGYEEWAPAAGTGLGAGLPPGSTSSGSISGTVINTQTGAGIPDVVVFLDTNGDGVMDNGEVYAITDCNGNYNFNDLAAGLGQLSTYNVRVVTDDSWTTSAPVDQVVLTTANPIATYQNFYLTSTQGNGVGNS